MSRMLKYNGDDIVSTDGTIAHVILNKQQIEAVRMVYRQERQREEREYRAMDRQAERDGFDEFNGM